MKPILFRMTATLGLLLVLLIQEGLLQEEVTTDQLKESLKQLARQAILQQFHTEEQTRYSGCSGIKQQRGTSDGTRPYHAPSFTGTSFMSIHGHPNFIRTVGLGEVVVVLNGVEFMTRHNDYQLVMPSTTSSNYEETEEIEYPAVPLEVLGKSTVEEQITEMREWFKAFQDQNHTVRDYRPYFKPVMTYLEGAWTYTGEEVDEPYASPRHFVDAPTWQNLQEQNRYNSYTGFKHSFENIPYLPRVLIDVASNGTPMYAQWNYRVLSQPLSFDLPLDRLRVVDDLHARISSGMTLEEYKVSPKARFSILPEDLSPSGETGTYNQLLERIMREIPGKDNHQGNLTEDGYWGLVVDSLTGKPINTAFYHRRFSKKLGRADPRKEQVHGFSDHTLYMAMTTQDKVVGMEDIRCATAKGKFACDKAKKKWTYCIPIEIIYLTPLQRWNPYNLVFKGEPESEEGMTVTADGRDGSKAKPFNGTHSKMYTQVPYGLYNDDTPAEDYPKGGFYVADAEGIARPVMASGITINFLAIPGIGRIRQRYPVAPVHDEGSAIWKEVQALKDIVLKPEQYKYMYYEEEDNANTGQESDIELVTGQSEGFDIPHFHTLKISGAQLEALRAGEFVVVTTDQAAGHTHKLKLMNSNDCTSTIAWKRCDQKLQCFDKHPNCLEDPNNQ